MVSYPLPAGEQDANARVGQGYGCIRAVQSALAGRRKAGDAQQYADKAVDLAVDSVADLTPMLAEQQRERIIREMALAMPPLSDETRARLRPLLAGTIPATVTTTEVA